MRPTATRNTDIITNLPFRPLPLLGNRHVQTVLGTYLPGQSWQPRTHEWQLPLPDGDRLVLHDSMPAEWQPGLPAAVLVHGLGGSHRSGYLLRLTRLLLAWHWRVVRVDLRGCGRGIALARRPYHAGCSDDIRAVLDFLGGEAPASPLVLVGYSLGGNIVLKLAGEAKDQPAPNLSAVAAINPPIDLLVASEEIRRPRNRLYERHFVQTLVGLARQRARYFPEHRQRFPRRLTLLQFDELYTAPRTGFASALDYYARASSLPWIAHIQVPTLIVTSQDDPLVPVTPFLDLPASPHVQVQIASGGGHLGFLGWDGAGGIRWIDRRIVEWLESTVPGTPVRASG